MSLWSLQEAKKYTDKEVKTVMDSIDAHLAEKATEAVLGHVKVDGETIIATNGVITAQTHITDSVTTDKWQWGMANGIAFLEKVVI